LAINTCTCLFRKSEYNTFRISGEQHVRVTNHSILISTQLLLLPIARHYGRQSESRTSRPSCSKEWLPPTTPLSYWTPLLQHTHLTPSKPTAP